jgi:transposase
LKGTVNSYLEKFRRRIAEICEEQSPYSGEVEVDESWFGARRVKGKRGRGAYGKTDVGKGISGDIQRSRY